MRLVLAVFSAVFALQMFCYNSDVWSQSEPVESPRSGWYVGATLGLNRANDIEQDGWNRDTFCYPTDACFDLDPIPRISGYRWHYNVEPARGAAIEVSFGRVLGPKRLELSLAQRKNGVSQVFRSVTNYDGVRMEDRRGGTIASNTRASIDDLVVRSFSLNAYYDLHGARIGISPYMGFGLGAAQVVMAGAHFSNDHQETSVGGQVYDPPLSFYNSRQDGDLSDVVPVGSVHAGADYTVGDRTTLGLKLTYSMTGGAEVRGKYSTHPMHSLDPDFPNHNTFAGARQWTLTLNARRIFGN